MGLIEDQTKAGKRRIEQEKIIPLITAGQIGLIILILIYIAAAIFILTDNDGTDKGIKEVEVKVGSYNDTYVEIKEGLKEGDKVLLVPPKLKDSPWTPPLDEDPLINHREPDELEKDMAE